VQEAGLALLAGMVEGQGDEMAWEVQIQVALEGMAILAAELMPYAMAVEEVDPLALVVQKQGRLPLSAWTVQLQVEEEPVAPGMRTFSSF
jgi:hypothetical protein